MSSSQAIRLVKTTFSEWSEDKVPRLAAALAYYTMFSLAPLTIIVLFVAGMFLDEEAARGGLTHQLQDLVGRSGAKAIESIVAASEKPLAGTIGTIVGVVTLLFGAAGLFGQLQDALNTIWEVTPKPGRGIWGIIRDRFFSFTMVLGVAFVLLVSLVITTGLSASIKYLGDMLPVAGIVAQVTNIVVSFGVVTLLFAMIYKILPDVRIAWSDVWVGAAVTALLFTIGKYLISLYMAHAAPESTYGAAGSLVALLIWIYYSSQILFLGAEFTKVYAKAYGSQIKPSSNAMPMTVEMRAEQGIAKGPSEHAQPEPRQPHWQAQPALPALSSPRRPRVAMRGAPPDPKRVLAGAAGAFACGLLFGWGSTVRNRRKAEKALRSGREKAHAR